MTKMIELSAEAKESIVLQGFNRGSRSIEEIAHANNIGASTLHKWMKAYREKTSMEPTGHGKRESSRALQLEHLLATHALDEESLGAYCRRHGIYSHELTKWREAFMKPTKTKSDTKQKAEIKQLKEKNKRLERELRQKEKALAEASALLILKKKADLIWGEDEVD